MYQSGVAMKKKCNLLLFILLLSVYAEDTLHFILPNFKPFTYQESGEFKGLGVERVSSILNNSNIPYRFTLAPNYGRAVEETRRKRSDGFFLATQNRERDEIAHFSNPILMNRWCSIKNPS